jgi:coenzyme F420-reducing hydrogenase alpha subunit
MSPERKSSATRKTRTIRVNELTRVEGEGSLYLKVKRGEVTDTRLDIFEPPRFFEAFLRDRAFTEAPDITARICGICPVAYQMSACHAMENACGVTVDGPLRALRRLLYCGEWIESHALHVYMLHAPDFLGFESAIHMAGEHGDAVQRGLRIKKTGNDLLDVVGGRAVHPINVRVGGFYKVPRRSELEALREALERARDESVETVHWVAGFEYPDFERNYDFVALSHPEEYPFNEGRLRATNGLDIPVEEYEQHFMEEHVRHSTALHGRFRNGGLYFVGPLARYNLNFDKLSPLARETAEAVGLESYCRNPFKSIMVRGVELVFACEEALRLIDTYEEAGSPFVEVAPKASTGHGCTEAPRGILYHKYSLDNDGRILEAKIVPPTAQNQPTIEEDLRAYAEARLNLSDEELRWQCEQAIRNYDPCISCSTHFLRVDIERE